MKKIFLTLIVLVMTVLTACGQTTYEKIDDDENFIASVNTLQPSIDFFRSNGEKIATWELDEAYTGATLVGDEKMLLYGNQLKHADLVNLATGKVEKKIDVEKGATFAYYAKDSKQFFIANGEFNEVTAYTSDGEVNGKAKAGLYPYAMLTHDNQLFVVNFKDKFMSVFNEKTLKLEKKVPIPKSSHGMDFINEELWLGGHGDGEKPNSTVLRIDPKTSETIGKLDLPIMPIAFAKLHQSEFVLSHGESTLYEIQNNKVKWQKEVGSNPFAITAFDGKIIVGGYDDRTLYWIENRKIVKKTKVGKGPFQLLVRERER
ncbi:hypothetical protein KZO01_22280 [Kurthia zopfii]|uniref:Uncharacterized protein n=1 Tax=Kurthia zopfii TaxID=1650 RepID=A0A2U3AGX0_9BACL|nr:hypothetical protein [Kurthia zopfii]PWI23798.1 hypothetical protein DF281_01255 [Kurthia zopfii]TDR43373.1 hypothetical protein DFR61_10253 [Kurthia zopfii]STX10626.1 Uncharacterised protein [Kurthia zopfii]VEI06000.1 Uncharacterised protein [Kurthia zopfii]GEK31919.1 hypothetical protein KZO01_22280 [Kurthia zopfii]